MKPNVVQAPPKNNLFETPTEEQRTAAIRSMFQEKTAPIPRGTVGTDSSLRGRILQMSLFPNLSNKGR